MIIIIIVIIIIIIIIVIYPRPAVTAGRGADSPRPPPSWQEAPRSGRREEAHCFRSRFSECFIECSHRNRIHHEVPCFPSADPHSVRRAL